MSEVSWLAPLFLELNWFSDSPVLRALWRKARRSKLLSGILPKVFGQSWALFPALRAVFLKRGIVGDHESKYRDPTNATYILYR